MTETFDAWMRPSHPAIRELIIIDQAQNHGIYTGDNCALLWDHHGWRTGFQSLDVVNDPAIARGVLLNEMAKHGWKVKTSFVTQSSWFSTEPEIHILLQFTPYILIKQPFPS
jgi:hypothetical protein